MALYIRDCESLCLSDETLKAVGPFYLVSMPGEVKDPTQGVNMCNLWWTPHSNLEKNNSLNHSCVSPKMGCLEYKNTVIPSVTESTYYRSLPALRPVSSVKHPLSAHTLTLQLRAPDGN